MAVYSVGTTGSVPSCDFAVAIPLKRQVRCTAVLFTSIDFFLFLPLVFGVYWLLLARSLAGQNLWLLVASYVFYGWWDWRFLGLITFNALLDFTAALHIGPEHPLRNRRIALAATLSGNLGVLGFFKYFNFFVDSAAVLLTRLGLEAHPSTLKIVLPVGISFYTFQALSYTLEIYRGRIKPTRDVTAFLAYVSFFPQLVAGPIERAAHLLPQFLAPRVFDMQKVRDGLRRILWGLVKKVAIADVCARMVDRVYDNPSAFPGSAIWLATVFFAFQIYGDFSGYSDMAIGLSRLFGFEFNNNFDLPYFSRDPAEFWRRWHISLSTWFRDYVFIPLGGSRGGTYRTARNLMATFLISGLWHGANWTFVVWGFLNGLLVLPFALARRGGRLPIVGENRWLPSLREFFAMGLTFFAILITWVFFRASNWSMAGICIRQMFSMSVFVSPGPGLSELWRPAALIIVEWFTRQRAHPLHIAHWPLPARWLVYLLLSLLVIVSFSPGKSFIYFQF